MSINLNSVFDEEIKRAAQEASYNAEEMEMEQSVFDSLKQTMEGVSNWGSSQVEQILEADYNDVCDRFMDIAGSIISKQMGKIRRPKDVMAKFEAYDRVCAYIEEKKAAIEEKSESSKVAEMLMNFGAFFKSAIAKALKMIVATGKVVGKSAIIVSSLLAKVIVYTVKETFVAGKSVLLMAKEEYAQALR